MFDGAQRGHADLAMIAQVDQLLTLQGNEIPARAHLGLGGGGGLGFQVLFVRRRADSRLSRR
jgi:hypothetical protein